MSNKYYPTSVRLPPEMKKKIEELAAKEGRSINNMINRLLKKAVE